MHTPQHSELPIAPENIPAEELPLHIMQQVHHIGRTLQSLTPAERQRLQQISKTRTNLVEDHAPEYHGDIIDMSELTEQEADEQSEKRTEKSWVEKCCPDHTPNADAKPLSFTEREKNRHHAPENSYGLVV